MLSRKTYRIDNRERENERAERGEMEIIKERDE